MEGDKDMLLRFSGLWLARFSGSAQPPPELPQQQQQQQGTGQAQDQQHSRQQQANKPVQQQQDGSPQQQQQAGALGRKGPADFEGAAAAGSPWLTFLRAAYQVRPRTQPASRQCLFLHMEAVHRMKCCSMLGSKEELRFCAHRQQAFLQKHCTTFTSI
jgi:hypothetical protein